MANKHENSEPGKGGLSVKVYDNNIEKAIKIFKKRVMTDGIIREYRDRQHYERPGEIRRRQRSEARRRHLRDVALRIKTEGY